ncbi:MAG: hypothetical protein E7295_15245 [Lachnospiraceae bacterium]|jgi:uncharacterized membrane protein YobD (UPF0266 family)|nr:hypothetical protein [Lachnospiraceae bacterium]
MDKNRKVEGIKEFLVFLRDAMAYLFSWLVICTVVVSLLIGNEFIKLSLLIKIFVLCLWGVISFAICFRNHGIRKKGFIFSLTVFYVLFIPVEIAMFYFMGIFDSRGNVASWIMFGLIVAGAYVVSVLTDFLVMKKKTVVYTEKLNEYVTNRVEGRIK